MHVAACRSTGRRLQHVKHYSLVSDLVITDQVCVFLYQILERSILRALRLNDTALLPLHVHVHQLQLPRANPTAKSMKANRELFTLTAPLPDFFTQSLKDLGLNDEDLGADR